MRDDWGFKRGELVHYRLPPRNQRSKYDVYLSKQRCLVVWIVGNDCLLLKENGELRWQECQHLEKADETGKNRCVQQKINL